MKTLFYKFVIAAVIGIMSLPMGLLIAKVFDYELNMYPDGTLCRYWYKYKKAAMLVTEGHDSRIVIVSGSNSTFGVDAKKLGEMLNLPVVNFGTHAGLGKYIFYAVKPYLRNGDTVLLPLEWEYYNSKTETVGVSSAAAQQIIQNDFGYLLHANPKEWYDVAKFFWGNIKLMLKRLRHNRANGLCPNTGSYTLDYELNTVNYGGMSPNLRNNIKNSKYDEQTHLEKSVSFNDCGKWELTKFIHWCRKRGIDVYGIAPNLYHSPLLYASEKQTEKQVRDYYASNGAGFIGEIKDSFYSEEFMYDTNYHLNRRGRELRTQYLAKELRKILNQ